MEKRKQDFLTLLPEGIDHKVMVMVKEIRESGVVGFSVTIAVATKTIMVNDRALLKERGTIELEKKCESVSMIANLIDF